MNAGFFTRRRVFEVPHDRIGIRWMLLLHACVAKAFVIIRERGGNLGHAGENAITNELENVLKNDLLHRDDEVSLDFVREVSRGSEVENYNGEKISKKPDLIFHLQRVNEVWDRRQDAVFAECKPVDKNHSLSRHYCAVGKDCNGIERFIVGDYAWAMHEAMMIGYVRQGLSILPHLADALASSTVRKGLGEPSQPTSVESRSHQHRHSLYKTTHERSFSWRNGKKATPIDIFHSWHDCE